MRRSLMVIMSVALLWSLALYFNKNGEINIGTMNKEMPSTRQVTVVKDTEEVPRIGFKAPGFELASLDKKSYSLDDMKGKPVVLNFWASWCGPCKMEAPMLSRYYQKYKGRIEVYAINTTSNDSVKAAKAFADKYHFQFPVLLDQEGTVSKMYEVQAIPTTFFINKEGIIIDQVIGLADPKSLEDKFKKILAEE